MITAMKLDMGIGFLCLHNVCFGSSVCVCPYVRMFVSSSICVGVCYMFVVNDMM